MTSLPVWAMSRLLSPGGCPAPRLVSEFEHRVCRPGVWAVVGAVEVQCFGSGFAEAEGGGGFVGVAEQPDDGAAFAGVVREPVQVAGAGHPGFVDQDEVARFEDEPRILGSPGWGGVVRAPPWVWRPEHRSHKPVRRGFRLGSTAGATEDTARPGPRTKAPTHSRYSDSFV